MSNEKTATRMRGSEEMATGTLKNGKSCFDCLYCKVSAGSTDNCRLCFCSRSQTMERHKEPYWLAKKPCGEFFDMSENSATVVIFPVVAMKRQPLLRKRDYEYV